MELAEVGKLLAVAAAYDNRQLREETAVAWKAALDLQVPELDPMLAQQIVVWWFSEDRGEYFQVGHLIAEAKRRLRLLPEQIEADVRVAKARGLIGEWPDKKRLPADVAQRLAELRANQNQLELERGGFGEVVR